MSAWLLAKLLAGGSGGVSLDPVVSDLPGGAALQKITDGIGGWALVLTLVGLVIGAAVWALGAHSQNYQQSYVGRRAVIVCGLAALLIGAAPAIINFLWSTGNSVS
jgi:MFS family permease